MDFSMNRYKFSIIPWGFDYDKHMNIFNYANKCWKAVSGIAPIFVTHIGSFIYLIV